jgi:hypothetical protein
LTILSQLAFAKNRMVFATSRIIEVIFTTEC